MNTSVPTIRDLFLSTKDGELGAGLRLPAVPAGLSQFVTGFEWQGLAERVGDLLDINVADVLLAGWKKHGEVLAQLGMTAADPSRTVLVHIGHHTLHSTHTPSIELRSYGRTLMELSFPIDLAFEIAAVELTLRAGAVREIRTGEVKVRGTVRLENTIILQREMSPVRLPGRIVLDEALPQPVQARETSAAAAL